MSQKREIMFAEKIKEPEVSLTTKHFDRTASSYADCYLNADSTTGYFFSQRYDIVLDVLRRMKAGTLLDAGCGPGMYSKECTSLGFRYFGMDASSNMISECNRRFGEIELSTFFTGKVESIPFKNETFDVVLCLGVLEYLEERKRHIALAELRRVLKPNGVLILSLLNRSSIFWLWLDYPYRPLLFIYRNAKGVFSRSKRKKFSECVGELAVTRKFRLSAVLNSLRAMRFEPVEHKFFAASIFPQPLDTRLPYYLVKSEQRLEKVLNVPGYHWMAKAFIVVANKMPLAPDNQPSNANSRARV